MSGAYGTNLERVLTDPAASSWLKTALANALNRDPLDAANDAEVLAQILTDRATAELSRALAGQRT